MHYFIDHSQCEVENYFSLSIGIRSFYKTKIIWSISKVLAWRMVITLSYSFQGLIQQPINKANDIIRRLRTEELHTIITSVCWFSQRTRCYSRDMSPYIIGVNNWLRGAIIYVRNRPTMRVKNDGFVIGMTMKVECRYGYLWWFTLEW